MESDEDVNMDSDSDHRGAYYFRHPVLDSTPCDIDGNDLAPEQTPSSPNSPAQNPWTPFAGRSHFELADLLFRRNQMPAQQVDDLMQILAGMNKTSVPPFANSKDLHTTIDSIHSGDVPWQSLAVRHADADGLWAQDPDVPLWKLAEYNVWFQDPRELVRNQLSNPDFANSIDYSPRQVFGDEGQ